MDFVRMRHGNAVWHRVTRRQLWGSATEVITLCQPDGYCFESTHTELITAEHPPGRLCRVCARKSEREVAA